MKTMYTVQMLADRWACSTRIARHIIAHGKLKYIRLEGRNLILSEDVEAFERQL